MRVLGKDYYLPGYATALEAAQAGNEALLADGVAEEHLLFVPGARTIFVKQATRKTSAQSEATRKAKLHAPGNQHLLEDYNSRKAATDAKQRECAIPCPALPTAV